MNKPTSNSRFSFMSLRRSTKIETKKTLKPLLAPHLKYRTMKSILKAFISQGSHMQTSQLDSDMSTHDRMKLSLRAQLRLKSAFVCLGNELIYSKVNYKSQCKLISGANVGNLLARHLCLLSFPSLN